MKCKVTYCQERANRGAMYCGPHQKDCDDVAKKKMFAGEPLPDGNKLRESFGKGLAEEAKRIDWNR